MIMHYRMMLPEHFAELDLFQPTLKLHPKFKLENKKKRDKVGL